MPPAVSQKMIFPRLTWPSLHKNGLIYCCAAPFNPLAAVNASKQPATTRRVFCLSKEQLAERLTCKWLLTLLMDTAAATQQPCSVCTKRILGHNSFSLFTQQLQRSKSSADAGAGVTAGRRGAKQPVAALQRSRLLIPASPSQSLDLQLQSQTPGRFRQETAWQLSATADLPQAAACVEQVKCMPCASIAIDDFSYFQRDATYCNAPQHATSNSLSFASHRCRRGAAATQSSCGSHWAWFWRRIDTVVFTWCVHALHPLQRLAPTNAHSFQSHAATCSSTGFAPVLQLPPRHKLSHHRPHD